MAISKGLNMPATTSEYSNNSTDTSSDNDILPPIFDPKFQDYMDKRLKLLLAIKQYDKEQEEKICSCNIM